MTWRGTALLLAAYSISACMATGTPAGGPAGANRVLLFPASSLPALSVSLPPGFRADRLQGIDSEVARITGPGVLMNVDYGQGGGNQECGSLADCRGFRETVDGRVVTWIRQRKTMQIDDQTFAEQMHFFIPARPGTMQSAGPQAGARFSAVCNPDCSEAQRIALSARLQ